MTFLLSLFLRPLPVLAWNDRNSVKLEAKLPKNSIFRHFLFVGAGQGGCKPLFDSRRISRPKKLRRRRQPRLQDELVGAERKNPLDPPG
jgi:hypothetical protein